MGRLADLAFGIFTNEVTDGLNRAVKTFAEKQALKNFENQIYTWLENFEKEYDGTIAAKDSFFFYVKNYRIIERIIYYVHNPSFIEETEEDYKKKLYQWILDGVKEKEEETGSTFGNDDGEVIQKFIDGIFTQTKEFLHRQTDAATQSILYGIAQIKTRLEQNQNKELPAPSSEQDFVQLKNTLRNSFEEEKRQNPSSKGIEIDRRLMPNGSILDECTVISDEYPHSYTLSEFVRFSWEKKRKYLSLFGVGGIGKTVSLLLLECGIPMVYVPLRALQNFENGVPVSNYIEQKTLHSNGKDYKKLEKLSEQEWTDKPRLLLILDGVNEVDNDRKKVVLREIENIWLYRKGIQLILASRHDAATEIYREGFCRLRFHILDHEKIEQFLRKNGIEIPKPSSRLWNVIDTPLMLTLYARSQFLKGQNQYREVSWRKNVNAGAIIWNYLQSEVCRLRQDHQDYLSGAVIAELIAPRISYEMAKKQEFIVSRTVFQTYINIAYSQYLQQNEKDSFPRHICLLKQREGAIDIRKDDIYRFLTVTLNLFLESENGKSVQFMHQNFRDCFAAIHIFQKAETAEGMGEEIPQEWTEPFHIYTLEFLADLIQTEEICESDTGVWDKIWDYNYQKRPDSSAFIAKMLNLYKLSYGKDISNIDFCDVDLSAVSLSGYDLKNSRKKFCGTRLGPDTFWGNDHHMTVSAVSWCPDNRYFLSASYDCTLRIWNIEDGSCRIIEKTMNPHKRYIRCAAWCPGDVHSFVSAGDDKSLVLWKYNQESRNWISQEIGSCKDWIIKLAWSPDGKKIVCGDRGGNVSLFSLNGECLCREKTHGETVRYVSWSPDGKSTFATGADDGVICVWRGEKPVLIKKLSFKPSQLTSISWAGGGKILVVSSTSAIVLIDMEALLDSGKEWDGTDSEFVIEKISKESISFAASITKEDFDYIAVFYKNTIEIYKGCVVHKEYHIFSVAIRDMNFYDMNKIVCADWTSDCGRLICSSRDGVICEIGVTVAEEAADRITFRLISRKCLLSARCSSWSHDGGKLAVGYDSGEIRIWDIKKKCCEKIMEGHEDSIKCVAWSPDDGYLVSGADDFSVRVWEVSTGKNVRSHRKHTGPVNSILWLNNHCIISGSDDKTLRIWDYESDKFSQPLKGHTKRIYSIAVSPDGTFAVSGGNDKKICLWDISGRKCIQTIDSGHEESIRGLAWSLDGHWIFSSSNDYTLIRRSFDREKSQISEEFEQLPREHEDFIYSLAISGNNKYIITGSTDTDVGFWDIETKKLLAKAKAHESFVWNVSAGPQTDGMFLAASTSSDSTVKIWDVTEIKDKKVPLYADFPVIPGINIVNCDFSGAKIETEKLRELLAVNGGRV